ncbi:PhaM family polyhydroxyalkanoate granule multifunctional regulatory protein [Azovibrio restrictus]|uniref:PhaM family polyhydroxyalkanoate granule multifunctional regulatory protein n=1 Tax=Azovibrio restrictus TaxID=146938 RepID=UPI0026EB506F|nr:PhaM family polyhydroxyalkanoate granule multifunctional regulatory protein [Azovibrio restrictus]
MSQEHQDPMDFLRQMWGGMGISLPGMVAPTFDVDELEKRIADLKAVEGWLRMNLSMLQMTIQGLEMQKATLTAVHAMSKMGENPAAAPSGEAGQTVGETLSQAALWPWNLMQQMQEQLQQETQNATAQAAAPSPRPTKAAGRKPKKEGS